MSDTVVVLDDVPGLACAEGHVLRSFQTKDLRDSSMSTYLVHEGRLYLAASEGGHLDGTEQWRVVGTEAIREHRFRLEEVAGQRTVRIYGSCDRCEPVLVRTDRTFLGDFVDEHAVFVDFELTFRPGEPAQAVRTSGSRAELREELRRRGVYVLDDDEPLAVAHREIKRIRDHDSGTGSRRGFR